MGLCRRRWQEAESIGQIKNGSFETADGENPTGWEPHRWRGSGQPIHADQGRNGGRSVMIESAQGGDLSWSHIVPVRPFSKYRLTGWIKTEDLETMTGRGALFNLHGIRDAETAVLTGTNDWTQVELVFETDRNDAVQVNCLFGGWGLARGKAWYDDIELELLTAGSMKPEVVIQADKTRHPISEYVYGQFIEHLGRCIYGGLWAEMLEDRKFFYPVTDDYAPWGEEEKPVWESGVFPVLKASPWQVIGGTGTVWMDTERPFVGAHTPTIHLPGDGSAAGIRQEGLALEEGKSYTGRIVLAGESSAAPVEVRLVLQDDRVLVHDIETVTKHFRTEPFRFTPSASSDNASIEIVSRGSGSFRVGTLSLMPGDHVKGFRADVVDLLRELDAPIYRWPGGNFVSGYDWRDGIGERDRRPPRKNPAWTGIEHNDVGIHEYMDLMDIIDAEPFIAVNTGLGTVRDVSDEVAYCNDPPDTPMGRLRSENGHPEPFNVMYWAVGNEMYGSWQLGHMPLTDYVKKHNAVVEAMRRVDPSIRLVAVGSVGEWSETMMRECSGHMDLISEHIYASERPGLLGHTAWLAEMIRWKADAHRGYRETIPGLAEKDIRIAMDEWNYWYGPHVFGELGVRYFLKDALGVAVGLHEFFRQSDLYFMANYAQTVNVIGAVKTTRTQAEFASTGLVLRLYRNHFGVLPVEISGNPDPLDIAATWTRDRGILTIAVVNPTQKKWRCPVRIQGCVLTGTGTVWMISGKHPEAFNSPGEARQVTLEERRIRKIDDTWPIPPVSVVLYALECSY